MPDDRDTIVPGDRTVLIVEDDVDLRAHPARHGAREGLQGHRGHARRDGAAARRSATAPTPSRSTSQLPDMEGWTVLDRLKHDRVTRHIPVHIISGDEETARGLRLGAFAQMQKPVTKEALDDAFAKIQGFLERPNKSLLVVEDNEEQRSAIVELIGEGDVEITAVGTRRGGAAAPRASAASTAWSSTSVCPT